MAVMTVLTFTFAMGVVVGRAAQPEDEGAEDPLARLDRNDGLKAQAELKKKGVPEVKREALSFPAVLSDDEIPAEVNAVLAAAAAEESDLSDSTILAEPPLAEELPESQSEVKQQIASAMPAAMAAGTAAGKLKRAAEESDPLVSAAISQPQTSEPAPVGEEGAFTLQVASYDQAGAAQAFVKGLRARGHQAFVVSADIPERGRYWRVRIGPFASRWQANAYRDKFEEQERMNTLVVRRRD